MQKKIGLTLLVVLVPLVTSAEEAQPAPEGCDKGLEQCVAEKREEFKDRGLLGLMIRPADDQTSGGHWVTCEVLSGGAAEEAGLQADDLVVAWAGKNTATLSNQQMTHLIESVKIGERTEIEVLRGGKRKSYILEARKPEPMIIEQWLLEYVYENFSEAEFRAYQAELLRKFPDQPDSSDR